MPYFFLSHAPDEDQIFVSRLFHDLSSAVSRLLGRIDSHQVGYLDSGQLGRLEDCRPPRWSVDARDALTTCQTFVALWSTRYFLSDHCGRAWSVFAQRLRRYQRQTGRRAPSLIPLIWSDDRVPFAAPVPRDEDLDLRPLTSATGEDLRVLIRLTSLRSDYQAFLDRLARRIVDSARLHQIPPAVPGEGLDTAVDAFAGSHRGAPSPGGGTLGPAQVSFAVIAGTREQMRPIRTHLGSYGDRREDWAPYRPAVPQPVTDRARAVAAQQRLGSTMVPIDAVAGRIGVARQRNEILVLLIDAWATQIDDLRTVLHEVNEHDDDTVAVLVPVSRDDPETRQNRGVLRAAVRSTFAGRSHRRDLMFHPEIGTADRFDTDLAMAIVEGQSRLHRLRPAPDDVRQAPASERPILDGP